MNVRARAPVGSIRMRRHASVGRAMNNPARIAPAAPSPPLPISVRMVRLRGNAPDSRAPPPLPPPGKLIGRRSKQPADLGARLRKPRQDLIPRLVLRLVPPHQLSSL